MRIVSHLRFYLLNNVENVGLTIKVVVFKVHLNVSVADGGFGVRVNFHGNVGLDVSETGKLVEMPPEGIP